MTVNSYQDLADELGAQSERRYELWREWAGQYALAATERELRTEEVTRAPLPLAGVRRRWVVLGTLLLIGFLALFVRLVFIAVHGA